MRSKLLTMAAEAIRIEDDLRFRLKGKEDMMRDFQDGYYDVYVFEQVWGSTALGFGGIGGQAMTSANTYVLGPFGDNAKYLVYFGGEFAYAADWNDEFQNDFKNHNMESVVHSGKYRNK